MRSTGRHSEKSGYLVILLLVVGLTAFSHSMKELTEIHLLTLDASRLVAQWSGNVTPAEIPQVPQIAQTVIRIEKHKSCESKQSAPAVELPWLTESSAVAPVRKQIKIERPKRPAIPSEAQLAKLKKLQRFDIDADAFEVRVPTVQLPDADEFPALTFKTKTRKPGTFRINPRDREMLLKTLNRSINLRIAS
ncbi:MAG TPA: hypothetical protein VKB05_18745 [Pyrinomonadaceae bacterium]|nr:hypothetical protein [Pyrinomonadaceae bacterium]